MTEKKNKKNTDWVSLVDDPFQIKTLEVLKAQEQEDEIALDRDIEELPLPDDEQLKRLTQAISEAVEEEALALKAQENLEVAQTLAEQIQEDELLSKAFLEANALSSEDSVEMEVSLDLVETQACIETLLFMLDKPVASEKLREMLGDVSLPLFQEAMTALRDRYRKPEHGVEIAEVAGGFQLRTKPGKATLAKKLAKVQTQRLSSGAMETLAIVAYRQPVMKEDIDKIRGVDSSYFIRGLMNRKLIEISGRSELPGRPMLYSTNREFLELFGLKDLSSLPSLREIEQMIPASQSDNPDDEDPKVREMRKLVNQMKMDPTANLNYDPKEDEQILRDIRERVQAIPSSTPYLDEQKALERQALQQAIQEATAQAAGPPLSPESDPESLPQKPLILPESE